jgi:O-antigen/teichoic acid export membrane protein
MRFGRLFSSAGFAVVAALPAGSNFLLTLILVRTLSTPMFAAWSVVEPTFLIFSTLASFGLQFGTLFVTASGASTPRQALGNAILCATPVAILGSLGVWWVSRGALPGVLLPTMVLALTAETLSLLTISSMRGQRLIGRWILFECVRSVAPVATIGVLFLLGSDRIRSVEDLLLLRGLFTALAVGAVLASQRVVPVFDRALVIRMLRYGGPIALAAGVTATISGADRFLLALLDRPAAEIAQYAAHQRLAGLITVAVVTPLNLWFAVEAIRRDTTQEAAFFQRTVLTVLALLAAMMILAMLLGPLVWPVMFPRIAFNPAIYVFLAGAIAAQAIGIVTNIGVLREKSTHISTVVATASGSVMLACGIGFITLIGVAGAAAARFAALATTLVIGRVTSQRIAPVAHRATRLAPFAASIALAAAMLFAPQLGTPRWPWFAAALAAWLWGAFRNRDMLKAAVARG